MAVREIGPWQLRVSDHAGQLFERYLAFDGQRVAWLWRLLSHQLDDRDEELMRTTYDGWRKAGPPWLKVERVSRGNDGLALITEAAIGVRFSDLVGSSSATAIPLGAAAHLALEVARAMNAIDERVDAVHVRDFAADSLLIGFDGSVRLTPWPDLAPPGSRSYTPVTKLDYYLPEQIRWIEPMPGWRAWGPSLVMLHALGGRSPFRGESAMETPHNIVTGTLVQPKVLVEVPVPLRAMVAGALSARTQRRPTQAKLIAALEPLADKSWLEESLRKHFPAEEHEQRFEHTLAEGKDPEPLPPELVRSAAADGDDDAFGVLADWMLSQGRPRGELAAIQRRIARGADLELQRAEAELLVRHRSLLPHSLRDRLAQWKPIWNAGWLVGLELRAVPPAPDLEEILTHPTLRFLRRLRVSENAGHSQTVADVLSAIELPALKTVELDGAMPTHGARLKAARPQLDVARTQDHAGFPPRRRPEKAVPNAKVGLDGRAPAQGIGFLDRVWDWLNRGD